ncbi:Na+/H+ antiporter subunit E [Streptomyces sp. ACA25]|uniref:Na+/H+ antiporter subunit E n=1 Tax=Streptomyces sp. ACA25 TaxID=3022596 RepID=UPI0023079A03|nr:Na+/H+ antiporter subunit E [Streptomyces sp. ACA25]MDB1087726.1 Na+/H+ antiporter subunit E [Streptomyces sp. ACA25]
MSSLARRTRLRAYRVATFLVSFSYQFLEANMVIAWEILTPGTRLAPAIVKLPLRCRSRGEVMTLTSLVSLTPGTLAIEVETEPFILYVHGTHAQDVEGFRTKLHDLETLMLGALRPVDEIPGAPGEGRAG